MKELLILRHAKSSWKDDSLADHDRPLNKRGKRDAPRMGKLLQDEELVPDLIICSTAQRAALTAEAVVGECAYDHDVTFDDRLYHADPDTIARVLHTVPDDVGRLLVIGHNPGLEELVAGLTGCWEEVPTAALIQIDIATSEWHHVALDGQSVIKDIWRPKELA